ncbi:MAG TPA: hypothetical protein VFV95_10360 [Vicinamibacterales bacterium]|nr:hypothetical protein [Vicinamibacterales bacterium]
MPSATHVPDDLLPASGPVSVGASLERQVAFEWYESVAIVSGICAAVGPGDTAFVPAWHDWLLTPEGAIVLRKGARSDAPVTELPRLLHALLSRSSIPAPLRLFVVHAISSNSHRSARSFGEALAYYERPNRRENLQSAYQRYLETPAERPQEPPPIVEPKPTAVDDQAARPRARSRRARIGVVAALMCATAGALVLVARFGPTGFDAPGSLAALASRAGEVARTAGGELFQLVSSETPPVEAAKPEAPRTRRTTRQSPRRPRPVVSVPPIETDLPMLRNVVAVKEQPAPVAELTAPGLALAGLTEAELTAAETPGRSPESVIYTSESVDVVAPVLIDPVRLPAAVRAANGNTGAVMEIIVTETGTVERARFLTPPERMTDVMLLSAVKTWVFRPGMKDGRPVSYRVVTDWSSLR